MENRTWIKLYRKIKEKGWYHKSEYVHLWVHILIRAEHEEKEFMWNGSIKKTKRGEFITGRDKLSQETGIKRSTIENILKLFEKEGQIKQQKTTKFRLIQVLNYESYQTNEQQSSNKVATKQQQSSTYKELKEQKEDIAAKAADEIFNQDRYIGGMRKNSSPHIRLIGWYFSKRGSQFPDEKSIKDEIKRWVKDASFIVRYGPDKIASTHQWVESKFPEEWNLSTIRKYISEK